MTRLLVDAGFGYTVANPAAIVWTDISTYVDLAIGVLITGGASDEVSDIQPATATLSLDNLDGRFSSGLATGAYWPNVKKNTPIRIAEAVLDTPSGAAPYPLAQLSDDFDDNRVNTVLWPDNFGGAVEVGGRARVPAVAGAVGSYGSVRQWTLTGSQTTVRLVTIPSPGGGATTARTAFMVNAVTSGTRIGFMIDAVPGTIACRSDVGSADGAAVTLTFDPIAHAWLRVRESAGTIYWETSPTGYDWTVRRSLATPAWVGTDQVALQLSATRDAGTADYAEYDLVGATVHSRFWGMVNEWPSRLKGLQATVSITCTDLFKWLSRQPALGPMLTQEILLLAPLSYYPLAEPDGSTTVGDLSGQTTTVLGIVQAGAGGTLTFAGTPGPDATGQSCPAFAPASATAGKYLTADLGATFQTQVNFTPMAVEAWFQTSVTDRVIFSLKSPAGDNQVTFALEVTTGKLQVTSVNPTTALATLAFATPNLADGLWHQVVLSENLQSAYVDGIEYGFGSYATMHDIRQLSVGSSFGTRLWSGAIAHVAVYTYLSINAGSAAAAHYPAGATGYAGEAASTRLQRLARYAGVSSLTTIGSTFDPQASQGPGGATALDMMRAVQATESAKLFANRNSFGLTVLSRDLRYNPTPQYTLAYADLETDDVELTDDDQKMINTVVASRPGGATQRVINQSARDFYGPYEPSEVSILKTSDNSVLDAANWTVSRYADPPPEIREISIEAYSMGAAAYRQLLNLGISSIVTVNGLPAQAPTATQTVFLEGYTETIKQGYHLLGFHTSRSYNDSVWVLDDPVYSALGSTTRLAY